MKQIDFKILLNIKILCFRRLFWHLIHFIRHLVKSAHSLQYLHSNHFCFKLNRNRISSFLFLQSLVLVNSNILLIANCSIPGAFKNVKTPYSLRHLGKYWNGFWVFQRVLFSIIVCMQSKKLRKQSCLGILTVSFLGNYWASLQHQNLFVETFFYLPLHVTFRFLTVVRGIILRFKALHRAFVFFTLKLIYSDFVWKFWAMVYAV